MPKEEKPVGPQDPTPPSTLERRSIEEPAAEGEETPEARLQRLTAALEEKTAEAARNADRYLRVLADFENFKKRMQKEKAEALRFASEGLIRDILPVLDNLERAVEHAEGAGSREPLLQGVQLVLREAREVLKKHGLRRVEAAGQAFDPSVHEAITMVPDASRGSNRVVEQFQAGYTLHERLLRPAQVSVSVKPQAHESRGSRPAPESSQEHVEKRRNDD